MTAAHIFYVPVILFVGLFAGFFLGQRAAEHSQQQRRKKLARRRALQKKRKDGSDDDEVADKKQITENHPAPP